MDAERASDLLQAPMVGHELDFEPDYTLDVGCKCGSCWTSSGSWIVSRKDDKMLMEADVELLRSAAEGMAYVVRLEKERDEAVRLLQRLQSAADNVWRSGNDNDGRVDGDTMDAMGVVLIDCDSRK